MNKSFLKFITDFGPLLIFFTIYYKSGNNLSTAIPPLIISTLIAVAIMYFVEKKIPYVPLIAGFAGGLCQGGQLIKRSCGSVHFPIACCKFAPHVVISLGFSAVSFSVEGAGLGPVSAVGSILAGAEQFARRQSPDNSHSPPATRPR